MKCGICKAEAEKKYVSYTEDAAGGVIVIRNVPAHVCTECGNVWYAGAVSARIEKIVDAVIKTASIEVTVVNYTASDAQHAA